MPNPKHVRFDNKPTKRAHSDDDEDDDAEQKTKAKKPKIIKEEEAEKDEQKRAGEHSSATETAVGSNAEVDSKWENLVYYYLARLKGLCDWGSESPPEKCRATSAGSAKSCTSDKIEERVLRNVVTENYPQPSKYWAGNKRLNRPGQSEVSSYMAAGYQEGKEQGVKIVTRALKYGVLSGILAQIGSSYKIHPKYMKKPPSAESTSNSEISVLTSATSSNSGGSVRQNEAKHRTGLGAKSDKFQSEPDVQNVQMKRSFSHNAIDIFSRKPTTHRHYNRPGRRGSDLIFSRPSTSNNLQLAKYNARDQVQGVSSSKKHRVREMPSRNTPRPPTRDGLRSRPRLSRAQTREQGSRSKRREQRRKRRRPKSSSSNTSNY